MTDNANVRMGIVACLCVAGLFSDGHCSVQGVESNEIRDRLRRAMKMFEAEVKDEDRTDIGRLLGDVASITNQTDRHALFSLFEDRLFSVDPSGASYERQSGILDLVWRTAFRPSGCDGQGPMADSHESARLGAPPDGTHRKR